MSSVNQKIKKVLIYRQGSLGDTVVALPVFRLIHKAFPAARRYVLTNKPINSKACALEHVLANTGLVDEYLTYPPYCSLLKKFLLIRKAVKSVKPAVLVYLIPALSKKQAWRDFFFFKLCGVKKIIGLPLWGNTMDYLYDAQTHTYEYEGKRLARQLEGDLGKVDWSDPEVMDLSITPEEKASINPLLPDWAKEGDYFVFSIGTKLAIKDWGQANWIKLMKQLGEANPRGKAIFVGINEEYERSQELLSYWPGYQLNLCGQLSVRQTAALLAKAKMFVGHDSGPMHLAAAQKTPCVAIFSRKNKPCCWYPYGNQHKVLYPSGDSILSIKVEEVMNAISSQLNIELTSNQAVEGA